MDHAARVWLAEALRKTWAIHEASYNGASRRYEKTWADCSRELCGDDPMVLILDCLNVGGFCEMEQFCNEILGA